MLVFLGLGRVCLCKINYLYRIYTVAEYFLQDGQIVPVHGGNFSLFKLGGEPGQGDTEDLVKTFPRRIQTWLNRF